MIHIFIIIIILFYFIQYYNKDTFTSINSENNIENTENANYDIESNIENEIDTAFDGLIENIKTAKTLTTNIITGTKRLLELNWKLTALDYKELVVPVKPRNIDSIEELSLYISQCSSVDLITGKAQIKDDIVFSSSAYEINEEYLKLINPFVVLGGVSRAGRESPDIRCAKSCSYLKFRLPNIYIEKLVRQLEDIRGLIQANGLRLIQINMQL